MYHRLPARKGYPHLTETDVLVPIPSAYPGVMLDGAYLPTGSPLLGRVEGSPQGQTIQALGRTWQLVSYHPQRRWRTGMEQRPPRSSHLLHGSPVVDSTRASLMKPIRIIQDGREALWRITEADREKLLRLLFHRYPDSEWGTFFRFGYRRTRWGILIAWVDTLKPESGDLDRNSPLVEFRPAYIRRALAALDSDELGVGVIHSTRKTAQHSQVGQTMTWIVTLPRNSSASKRTALRQPHCRSKCRPRIGFQWSRIRPRKLAAGKNCLVVGERLLRERARQESNLFATARESAANGTTQERLTNFSAQLLRSDFTTR